MHYTLQRCNEEIYTEERVAHDYESFMCLACGSGHWSSEREGGGKIINFKHMES